MTTPKLINCSGPECSSRRVHWCSPDQERGIPRTVEVPEDWPENRPAYCSITCACAGGYMKVSCLNPCPKCLVQGTRIEHHGDYKCWQPEIKEETK